MGHPSISPDPAEERYIDLNRDGFIEFVDATTYPPPSDSQRTLHPLRGQKILTPSNVNRVGTQLSMEPPPDSAWSDHPLTLMHIGSSSGPFGGTQYFYRSIGVPNGTNGYIAVQFKAGSDSHLGWIQYNRYEVFWGVMGMSPLITPSLDYFDHGYQRTAGAPATIGVESSLPFSVQIQEEGNQLRLRWDPLRRNSACLEISTSIVSPAWAPAATPGTDNLLYPKPTNPGPLFFRLQPVEPNPPVVMP